MEKSRHPAVNIKKIELLSDNWYSLRKIIYDYQKKDGTKDGMMIEACAGILEQENAEESIRRETEEETGYKISKVEKVMEMYMSPGSVTEILYFFVAEYTTDMKINDGGGVAAEQEEIEVLELDFQEALAMVKSGEIKDAKTIMLLQYAQLNELLTVFG